MIDAPRSGAGGALPRVLVPWEGLDLPDQISVAVYDGSGATPELDAVEFYVMPYGGPDAVIDIVDAMPSLVAVQVLSAGYDDVAHRLPPGVDLYNGRGLHDASTAEHAIALMLSAQRELSRWAADQGAQRWEPAHTASLADCRVLIVGYGSIGAAIEERLRPFEVEVARVARTARPQEGVHGIGDLDGLLGDVDIVCVVTPLTDQTRGLFDDRRLNLMRPGALLVNVGRGAVVDTAALLAQHGRIRAALDVTDPEPLPVGHPLWSSPGVVITPHVAGGSATFHPRARTFVSRQVSRFARGVALLNRV